MRLERIGPLSNTIPLGLAIGAGIFGFATSFLGTIPMNEDMAELWLVSVGAFAVGVGIFAAGFGEFRRRSLVKNTPTSTIRSLSIGPVELQGTAVSDEESLKAPFSGESCVLFEYTIEEYRPDDDSPDWDIIETGASHTSFYLEDETGRILVDPTGADIRIPEDGTYTVDHFEELPDHAQTFIRNQTEVGSQAGELFEERRRYTESYLAPGEKTYIFGEAIPRTGQGGGVTNPENAYINREEDTPLFLIADRSESAVLSSMRSRVYGYLLGGFILTMGGYAGILFLTGLL